MAGVREQKRALHRGAKRSFKLTKANFLVESESTDGLLGHHLAGGKEHAVLLLESFLGL